MTSQGAILTAVEAIQTSLAAQSQNQYTVKPAWTSSEVSIACPPSVVVQLTGLTLLCCAFLEPHLGGGLSPAVPRGPADCHSLLQGAFPGVSTLPQAGLWNPLAKLKPQWLLSCCLPLP